MSRLTDQHYLRTEQYKDASNLNARICVHQRFSTNDYPWQRWVFDHLDLTGCCDILDVGCGPGGLWRENRERIPGGWAITLSDLSSGMVQKAQHSLGSDYPSFTYSVLDAQSIPFPDGSFDAVIANHMLYHVPERQRVLYEIRRVLRQGGHLYAATNGRQHLQELRELVARFCPNADIANVALDFGLENGAVQLSQFFAHVRIHRQENALVATEADPLIAYALSMTCQTALKQNVEAFSRSVREQISTRGAIHIQKDSGMFKATKA
jgi:ubiquinone/menaquinone biosynthesis C-methylase UbiE